MMNGSIKTNDATKYFQRRIDNINTSLLHADDEQKKYLLFKRDCHALALKAIDEYCEMDLINPLRKRIEQLEKENAELKSVK